MGLLDRAIKNGIGRAVGNAVTGAVEKAVAPKVEQTARQAAEQILPPTPERTEPARPVITEQQAQQASSVLGGLFGGLSSFANEVAKDKKLCPECGELAPAETKFCPKCGGKLPEQTLAQGAACPSCGKQNSVGMKFCTDCGAKLPATVAEEQAGQARDAAVLAQWGDMLPQYPKWQFGGYDLGLERLDDYDSAPYFRFWAYGVGRAEWEQYRQLLLANGFRPAGQYPDTTQLYARIGGAVYNADLEHAFEGDALELYFTQREPSGGFDYVKPEPKAKPKGLFDLFK